MNSIRLRRGFTLIELLVVIAIIGILAALIIVSLTGARARAQDTQRKNNARNLDTALAQYYTDSATSTYPNSAATNGTNGLAMTTDATCPAPLSTLVGTNGYLTAGNVCDDAADLSRHYLTGSSNQQYTLIWQLAAQTDSTVSTGNGVYVVASGAVNTPNQDTTTASGIGGTRAFVVYGPQ